MPRVLIIDDDHKICKCFKTMLEGAGYEVDAAPDGAAAMRLYAERPADLVITDIFMPEKDGLEVIAELRHVFKGPKILAISGGGTFAPEDFLAVAMSLGADAALVKAIDAKTLLRTVADLLA